MTIALVCIALLALLAFALGFAVSMARTRTGILHGYPEDPASRLCKLVRAHGNTMEYVPLLALLFYLVGLSAPPVWVLTLVVLATLSRFLAAAGLILSPTLAQPHPMRATGALGTYVCGLALAAVLLWQALPL